MPAIRPLETLHNALSLRQLDAFLERVTAAPVLAGTPPHAAPGASALPDTPAETAKRSPTNSESTNVHVSPSETKNVKSVR